MRRAIVCLALVLAGCGGGGGNSSSSSSATTASTPRPPAKPVATRPAFLGVTAGAPLLASTPLLDAETKVMARSGVSTLRISFYWTALQPTRGRTDWTKSDAVVSAAARTGIDLLPVVSGTPPWAALHAGSSSSPPRDPADYARLLTALVKRYGPDGSFWTAHPDVPKQPVRAWQIWNEPNHSFYWSEQPFAASYVRLLRAAHAAIKAADPGARVVLAGFPDRSWESLDQLEKAGAHGLFDAAAVHPYTFEPANVLKIVEFDRAALRRGGDGRTPLWLTEVTWSSGKGKVARPLGFETTPADQAARLSRALPLLIAQRRALGIQRIYWESWVTYDANRENPFDFSGLRAAQLNGVKPKPAFAAFARIARATSSGSRP